MPMEKENSKTKSMDLSVTVPSIPEECYKIYGNDLSRCSTQENEGCGRCPLYK